MTSGNVFGDLQAHLAGKLNVMRGPWVANKNSYEVHLCRALEFTADRSRYWDALWGAYRIELKKGTSIWIDLVRYSEILLKSTAQATADTITLFFFPTKAKDAVEEVVCVPTIALINFFGLNPEDARHLLALAEKLPCSLNAQASLTPAQVRKLAAFRVPEPLSLDDLL